MIKRNKTDFLFVKPSILHSIAAFFGLFDNYYEYNSSKNADFKAIQNDWAMIGQDLNDSIQDFEIDLEREKQSLSSPKTNQQLDLSFNE